MSDDLVTVEQVLTQLKESPRSIAEATAGVAPARLRTAPEPGEWSVGEVLAHLRSCADVWGGCIARILAEDGPRIRAVSPRGWIRKTGYLDLEFEPSLRSYAAQRGDLLAVLEALPRDAWSRAATVTAAGKTHEWTVFTYAQRIAQHEAVHVEQIAKAAGAAPDS